MPEPGPYRLLVTGSRTWTNVPIIRCVLSAIHCDHPDAVLVSGHCPEGGDLIAEQEWAGLCGYGTVDEAIAAGRIEAHPLDGKRYGRAAGPVRNGVMVKLGAGLCVAFLMPCVRRGCPEPHPHDSHGTAGCVRLARRAGIPVWPFCGEETPGGTR